MISQIVLLLGLPGLFAIKTMIGFPKALIYMVIFLIFLGDMNFKNLLLFNLRVNITYLFWLSLVLLFLLEYFLTNQNNTRQLVSLLVILGLIFILLSQNKNNFEKINEKNLLKVLIIVSSISVIFTAVSTPLDTNYWLQKGGRLYVGDTENPLIVSWTSGLNIIFILYYLFKYKLKYAIAISLIGMILLSMYIYLLSFSKSSILGILLIAIYFIRKIGLRKILIKKVTYIMIILSISIFIIFREQFVNIYKLLTLSVNSLLYNTGEILSADIRHENFKNTFVKYFTSDNFWGWGINSFRMDSPILQIIVDFGYFIGSLYVLFFFILPLVLIFYKIKTKKIELKEEIAIMIYLFFLPNFLFHGTPYEYIIWIPVIFFFCFVKFPKIIVWRKNYV
ncbi:hypothetical protein GWK41_08945 [Persephonella atlantica]|uniref:Uncharacterized protein n=1 Tax=Persephonella atlantica TaxID=2699429 RepID=A0ABS1GJV9_9AQUI|nr:hypothetical protein [Persephonella atlantica]MBK3333196.1 hypothetical protein [Persephonella atlantica]